jgi:hypothetical protein
MGSEVQRVESGIDAGISGKSMETRKGLQPALAGLKKDMVLVSYSLSRLARSTKDALEVAERVSLSKQLDGTTAAGRLMMAEFERNLIADAHHRRCSTSSGQVRNTQASLLWYRPGATAGGGVQHPGFTVPLQVRGGLLQCRAGFSRAASAHSYIIAYVYTTIRPREPKGTHGENPQTKGEPGSGGSFWITREAIEVLLVNQATATEIAAYLISGQIHG